MISNHFKRCYISYSETTDFLNVIEPLIWGRQLSAEWELSEEKLC